MESRNFSESFRVKSTGYVEQFSSYNAARQSFDRLKKKKEKEGLSSFKIVLQHKSKDGVWETMDSISIKD
ncbi:hypothetical protein [Runella salmonicolor]|uniref:Uncharacterized protein n=1 Tax=Runella salmonicolor TaxID=2950278 RepID=A0ABT1FQQ6_9BACT|nr:hypothetical protein [Runella salmonicolor]MCP1384052.1 hypothetical protein [Runella salmonicolor]